MKPEPALMPLTPLLRCTDLDQTRSFYDTVLGFRVAETAGNTITVEKDGARLLFTDRLLWPGTPALTGTLYITVPDVERFYAQVKDKVAISWPLQHMPYGSYEFGMTDCNGYLLAFQAQR